MFHEGAGHLEHDLGAPPHYGNATVLLSEGVENFRYFGSKCPVRYKKMFPRLREKKSRASRKVIGSIMTQSYMPSLCA